MKIDFETFYNKCPYFSDTDAKSYACAHPDVDSDGKCFSFACPLIESYEERVTGFDSDTIVIVDEALLLTLQNIEVKQ